jgi:poly-gamma-glutamate synthesis protein (capsule biosynthesis protein)
MRYASEQGNFTAALAGDCMLTRRLSVYDEPDYLGLVDIFRQADAGFVNLEGVVRTPNEGAPGITQGTYMTIAPKLLEDLKWFGINLVCCANNHAFDYGEGGLLATTRHLDAAGIAHAGSGQNLAEARMPGYLETRNGRVALIAATATFRPWNRAGEQRPDMQGRPGISPLRFKTTYQVDGQAFGELKRLARELGFERTTERSKTHFYSESEVATDTAEEMEIFGSHVVRGNGFKVTTEANKQDAEDILRWIREARRMADWVIVSLHSHEFGHNSLMTAKTKIDLSEPADFIPDFARAAIDAGADIFAGHGSHTPLGIEIYKGKPIFYSLGNIVFQNETVPFFPAEAYARFGLGPDATPADFLDARTGGGKKGHVAYEGFWQNIAAQTRFEGGKLAEIRLHPIDQGHGSARAERGRPVLANGKIASEILARIDRFSQPYGVRVTNEGGVGVIRP